MDDGFVFLKDLKKGLHVLYCGQKHLVLKIRTLKNSRKFAQFENLDTKMYMTMQFPTDCTQYLLTYQPTWPKA